MSPLYNNKEKNKYTVHKSIVSNLRYRELNGITSKSANRYSKRHGRLFSSIPSRLAFSLKDIVDEQTLLEEAHVFLGFNGNGTHVISYTESFEAMEQTGLLSYMYRLHWWLFKLNKKMIKISTVSLFANEEILSSLQLSYAEWPHEKSKIVVYGCSRNSENCYITVCAVPSLAKCENCVSSSGPVGEVKSTCLKHGFSAHMKHTSVSSFSAVLNASGLQIDNLMVLNMGHSIGVISLGLLGDDKDTETLPLSSIKRAAYEDRPNLSDGEDFAFPSNLDKGTDINSRLNMANLNTMLQSCADDEKFQGENSCFVAEFYNSFKVSSDSSEDALTNTQSDSTFSKEYSLLAASSSSEFSSTSQCITMDENLDNSQLCTCTSVSHSESRVEDTVDQTDNESCIDPYFDPEPKSIVLLQRGCENTCSSIELPSSGDYSKFIPTSDLKYAKTVDSSSENCCCGYSTQSRCSEHAASVVLSPKTDRAKNKHELKKTVIKKYSKAKHSVENVSVSPNGKQTNAKFCKKICNYCGLAICEQNVFQDRGKSKKKDVAANSVRSPLLGSPGRNPSKLLIVPSLRNTREAQENYLELNAPTPSPSASESSGSVYCTGDTASQVSNKSGYCHRTDGIVSFFETLYGRLRGLSNSGADDAVLGIENSLFYGPVSFEAKDGTPLHPVKSDCFHPPVAYSQHLVLDVEHVIFDVLRTRCYTTYKFGYLIDYDVQIIDTCSNTNSVVILIVALLNVAPRKNKVKLQEHHYRFNSNFEVSANKSQQFQFFISWQLQTGRYEVVVASPLHDFDSKKSGKWDASWVAETRNAIRLACALPHSSRCNVHVLNNASVFRGKSLNFLWDTHCVIALRK